MNQDVFKFEDFSLDPKHRKLTQGGRVVNLSSRAFEILLLLIQKQGQIVEKEEILQKVWHDSFVEEGNLAVHISALRRVLGEKRGEKKFIETVSGYGYSFVFPVEIINTNRKPLEAARSTSATELTPRSNSAQAASLAVLPLTGENLDADLQYLASGLTQSLIDNLSLISQLRVIAYSAVKNYADSSLNLQEIGFLLNVEKVLVGRVLKYKNNLEIFVELINAADERHIWGTRFECLLTDILEARNKLSLQISEKLYPQLNKTDETNLTKQQTTNPEAYQFFLKGKHILEIFPNTQNRYESLQSALSFFRQALKKDPNLAAAHAEIGRVYFFLFSNDFLSRREVLDKCRTALQMALTLDAKLSEAFVLKGMLEMFFERNLFEAEKSLNAALRFNSSNAYAYHMQSLLYVFLGKFQEAIALQNKAISFDPTSTAYNCGLINRFFFMHDFNKTIMQAEEAIELNERAAPAYLIMSLAYAQLGIYHKALESMQKYLEINISDEALLNQAYILALSGERQRAAEILKDFAVKSSLESNITGIAAIYAALGENKKALDWLEKDLFFNESFETFLLKYDPRFEPLQQEPRFKLLLNKIDSSQSPITAQ